MDPITKINNTSTVQDVEKYILNQYEQKEEAVVKTPQQKSADAADALFKKVSAWEATVGSAKGLYKIPAFFVCLFQHYICRQEAVTPTVAKLQKLVQEATLLPTGPGKQLSKAENEAITINLDEALDNFYAVFKERISGVKEEDKINYINAVAKEIKNPYDNSRINFHLAEHSERVTEPKMNILLTLFKEKCYKDAVADFAAGPSKTITTKTCQDLILRCTTILQGSDSRVSNDDITENLRQQLAVRGHVENLNKLVKEFEKADSSEVKALKQKIQDKRTRKRDEDAIIINMLRGIDPEKKDVDTMGLRVATNKGLIEQARLNLTTAQTELQKAEELFIKQWTGPESEGCCNRKIENQTMDEILETLIDPKKSAHSEAYKTAVKYAIARDNAKKNLEKAEKNYGIFVRALTERVPNEGWNHEHKVVSGPFFELNQSLAVEAIANSTAQKVQKRLAQYNDAIKFITATV